MSCSEDGQLHSPIDDEVSTDDADSLDIKPPQANFIKDANGSKRKEKSSKDKKHSKERKRKERYSESSVTLKQREKTYQHYQDSRVERRSDGDRRDLRRDDRHQQQRQSGGSGTSGYDDRDEYDKRYQNKTYDRRGNHLTDSTGGGGSGNYHYNDGYQHQPYQQHHQHQHQHNTHYYDRRQDYHQQPADYHITRHHHNPQQQHQSYTTCGNTKHHQEMEVERRSGNNKYSYDNQKDPESLEQDLRSRLLSKRHKYVREDAAVYYERTIRNYDEHEKQNQYQRSTSNNDRRKSRREKLSKEIIEVLDSPEGRRHYSQRKKHKRHKEKHDKKASPIENDIVVTSLDPFEKSRSPEDVELVARRTKLLVAEQEKQKRKGIARKGLECHREILRERDCGSTILMGTLSPSAVAARVTAGLHIIKRKAKSDEDVFRNKRSKRGGRYNKDNNAGDYAVGGANDKEDDSHSSSVSTDGNEERASSGCKGSNSDSSYQKRSSVKLKKYGRKRSVSNDDGEISLPNSPLSIGELSKSPNHGKRSNRRKQRKYSHKSQELGNHEKNIHEKCPRSPPESRSGSIFTLSPSRSRSPSVTRKLQRSRSKSSDSRCSRSVTPLPRSHSETHSLSSEHHRSRSPSVNSKSRSISRSRYSRSCSKSSSRSRSRSEERDMHESFCKEQNEKHNTHNNEVKKIESEKPLLDSKGKQLPNYYPGVQGCRSVEEFQCLNRIDEGTYGVVYRAKDKRTEEIVALKRLKMEKEKEGFPITSLREINTLLKGQHPNIVTVREIVVGSNMDKIYIVMDYVEHDLKSLMETMKARRQSFLPAEIKCLTQQLLKAVGHLHDNWILHRDLKTSNLLLSHKGILKVGDFGLAREYGSPLKQYTSVVVTLYYRAPELLLCSPEYSTPIDIWSVGCIFGEFLQMAPMFPGKSEVDQLNRFFKVLGTPNEKIWPGYNSLPVVKNMLSQNSQFTEYPVSNLRKYFGERTTENGVAFLQGLLTYDPKQRLSAELALKHEYFQELPLPIDPSMFPTWPAKSELGVRRALAISPKPPPGEGHAKQLPKDELPAGNSGGKIISGIITGNKKTSANTGFVLNAGIDRRHVAMGPGFKLKF